MTLSEGTVSPESGTTATTFKFTVVYTNSGGCSPDRIVVAVAGVGEFALAHLGGDLKAGATFGREMTLPAGARTYSFSAESGSGPGSRTTLTTVDPPQVLVVAPTPKPTPKPTVRPSAVPTVAPTPAATATATATAIPTVSTAAPIESPAQSPSNPTSVPSEPAATSAMAAPLPVDSPQPVGVAGVVPGAAWSAAAWWDRNVPRPVAALLVSSIGTLFGLALFAVLATRLIGTRQGRDPDPAARGSGE
jgi:hypothetical protein